MLSSAIRDLHLSYPGSFITEVRSSCPDLWLNNPLISRFKKGEQKVRKIDCHYPLVHDSNRLPYHFIHGFIHYLNDKLNLNIRPTSFKGDIHLSEEERTTRILERFGIEQPFWLLNAGGKNDFTIKWWEASRYQQVVDHFKDRILFVQIGAKEHYHPELNGVVDLRGKTSIRDLIQLTYHAQGAVTPVSFLMHLAAAVEMPTTNAGTRPCVVIAGGREPVHWEEYPGHQFIHTIGALACCSNGGCWKSRTVALGDGSPNDGKESLCVNVSSPILPMNREPLPRCMDMITADEVIRRIDLYFEGGAVDYLCEAKKEEEDRTTTDHPVPVLSKTPLLSTEFVASNGKPSRITESDSRKEIEGFVQTIGEYPKQRFNGKGIVICGGGVKYFPGTWVLVNMLRYQGCELPIEVWHLGEEELDVHMAELLRPLGVACIDGRKVAKEIPCRILKGWELKAYALLYSSFEEVLLLDADNVPVSNPSDLFSWSEYQQTGAVFWPDVGKLSKGRKIWELVGTPYRDEPEFESGQILINKSKCWEALNVSLWLNEFSDFYYDYIHGDKETFHMGFRKTNTEYSMPHHHVVLREGTMYQHDFRGRVVFQHRNGYKWSINRDANPHLKGFLYESECLGFVEVLKNLWNGKIGVHRTENGHSVSPTNGSKGEIAITSKLWYYERVGYDRRPMVFTQNGKISFGSAGCEQTWNIEGKGKGQKLIISGNDGVTCTLRPNESASLWIGQWLKHEQMPIKLIAINKT